MLSGNDSASATPMRSVGRPRVQDITDASEEEGEEEGTHDVFASLDDESSRAQEAALTRPLASRYHVRETPVTVEVSRLSHPHAQPG